MPLEAPSFWYRQRGALAAVLAPLGTLYGRIAEAKFTRATPYRSRLPVICVGNFTLGGSGKTPTAIAIASLLASLGTKPCFLTRGYGGKSKGPLLVSAGANAAEVGDEPLLLAEVAPTMISADRAAGAGAIEATDATAIIMDDGFQNPGLAKDLSLIVVDAGLGIGNGLVLPAGPLRAPLDAQIARADALIVIGSGGNAAPLELALASKEKPVLKARVVPRQDKRWLGVLPVIAFAGITAPDKFYATLGVNGARVIAKRSFGDHHRYTRREAATLLKEAEERKAMLVTTEKDFVRIPDEDGTPLGELKFRSRPFPIAIEFEDEGAVKALLAKALAKS
ncbi:MAG: tetraacyldisaccharide 4'-kinase [Actinomycetota bacterium]